MRRFNTTGPCDPTLHYYVPREELLQQTLKQIEGEGCDGITKRGRYFTLYAPRQTGKTTFVEAIGRRLGEEYLFLVLSFEGMIDVTEEEFCQLLAFRLNAKLSLCGIDLPEKGPWRIAELPRFFQIMRQITRRRLVLAIDEFDSLTGDYVGKILHVFREIYSDRGTLYNLHSLILIGVRNLTEIYLEHASPFNIADEIRLEPFTRTEVFDLIGQYEKETRQTFSPAVKDKIYTETNGQPGLVNELCQLLVERFNPIDPDRLRKGEVEPVEIGMDAFTRMLDYYINAYISKNVSNIISKAKEEETSVLRLFDTVVKVPYMVDEPWQKHLQVNGIIEYEEDPNSLRKYVKFSCPIYQKKLYAYFKPKLDLAFEQRNYLLPGEDYRSYLRSDGTLDLMAVLKSYQRYVNRRGSKAFSFAKQRRDGTRYEAVYHYSLDAYLSSFVDRLGGYSSVEFPTGNGRVDIWIWLNGRRYVVEVKSYVDETLLARAKVQTAQYARSEGLCEAYLVIFTEVHDRTANTLDFTEEVEGIKVYGVFINVGFKD